MGLSATCMTQLLRSRQHGHVRVLESGPSETRGVPGRAQLPPCRVWCTLINPRALPKRRCRLCGGGFDACETSQCLRDALAWREALTFMALKRSIPIPWRQVLQQASQLQLLQKSPLAKQSQYLWGQPHSLSQAVAESKPFPGNVHDAHCPLAPLLLSREHSRLAWTRQFLKSHLPISCRRPSATARETLTGREDAGDPRPHCSRAGLGVSPVGCCAGEMNAEDTRVTGSTLRPTHSQPRPPWKIERPRHCASSQPLWHFQLQSPCPASPWTTPHRLSHH